MTQKIYHVDKNLCHHQIFFFNTFKVALQYYFNVFKLFNIIFNLEFNLKLKIDPKMRSFKNLEEIWKTWKKV